MKNRRALFLLLGLVGLHAFALDRLDDADVVARALAAGEHTPLSALLAIAAFVLLRLVVYLVVPGLLLFFIADAGLAAYHSRSGREPPT